MKNYVKIENGVVVQRQPYAEIDFIEAPENVVCGWLFNDDEFTPPSPPPGPSQFDLDKARYEKRAAVKDELLAWMAADNMSRVRSGVWTVQDLTALLADPAVAAANQFMSTLSFELAAQAIAQASTPLLTPAIRSDWISRLQSHFYLVP